MEKECSLLLHFKSQLLVDPGSVVTPVKKDRMCFSSHQVRKPKTFEEGCAANTAVRKCLELNHWWYLHVLVSKPEDDTRLNNLGPVKTAIVKTCSMYTHRNILNIWSDIVWNIYSQYTSVFLGTVYAISNMHLLSICLIDWRMRQITEGKIPCLNMWKNAEIMFFPKEMPSSEVVFTPPKAVSHAMPACYDN